jgi:hypothetical protein
MGFISKLFGGPSSRTAINNQADTPTLPREIDDRIGSPNHPWVCEPPANLAELRRLVLDQLSDKPQGKAMATDSADMVALDAMIAEMMKMAYLRQVYGEEERDWECGVRMYLHGSIQTQEIRFKDGRPPEIFVADFSKFG